MDSGVITVSSNSKDARIWVEKGKVSDATLRCAFLIERGVPVSLSQVTETFGIMKVPCSTDAANNMFNLLSGWNSSTKFYIEWKDAPLVTADNEVVTRCRKYMLYSLLTEVSLGVYGDGTVKSCVTTVDSSIAFMAGHCLPRNIPKNSTFKVYDEDKNGYTVKIAYIEQYNEEDGDFDDFAILIIQEGKFPFFPRSMSYPNSGSPYFVLGYDGDYPSATQLSCFNATFRNVTLSQSTNFIIGSPGTTSGCSGGGVFSLLGELYGICISGRLISTSMSMPLYAHMQTLEKKLGEPSYSHIIPAIYLLSLIHTKMEKIGDVTKHS